MNYKYTSFGASMKLPYYCKVCGKSLVEGRVSKRNFDVYDGEQIYSVQIHCPDASKEDLKGLGRDAKHTVVYRDLKKRNDENNIPF